MNTINILNTPITPILKPIPNSVFKANSNDQNNDQNNESDPLDLQKNFLTLLLAQIQNQDPTDPIKNTELTSQLAQINMANGIERLNTTAANISNQINKNQTIQLTSLIGRHVMVPNNQLVHTENIKTKFGIELIGQATEINIQISDKNKKILFHKIIKKDTAPGIYTFSWDGKDLNQQIMKTGKYNISVTAKNKDKDVPIESLSASVVHGVITSPTNPIIDLGPDGNTTLPNIRQILT